MSLYRCSDDLYRCGLFDSQPWLDHAFGTARANPSGPFLTLKQVHSARVVEASEWHESLEADAILSRAPGVRIGVKTADCLPILIADPLNRAVAAVHAGWRGTVANISAAAVTGMRARYGSRPEDLLATIGPCIGGCCYEVGSDVGCLFREVFPERQDWRAGMRLDLAEANRRLLLGAGLRDSNVCLSQLCTVCMGDEFHSWRRDRKTGCRMYTVIGVLAGWGVRRV